MLSINRLSINRIGAGVAMIVVAVLAVSGCSQPEPHTSIPHVTVDGTRAFAFESFQQLADKSNAIVIVEATNAVTEVPLPSGYGEENSAPTPFVTVRVVKVLAGEVNGQMIDVVSPGIDENTGELSLESGGPYLLFLAPAMYFADDPAGGYVVTGGPSGFYAATSEDGKFDGTNTTFQWVDDPTEGSRLPATIDISHAGVLPTITKSEEQLLHEGP